MKSKKVVLLLFLISSSIWFSIVSSTYVSSTTRDITESYNLESLKKDNLNLIGQWDQNYGFSENIFIQDNFAFLAGEGLVIFDISNPALPTFVSQFKDNETGISQGVFVQDDLAFIVGYYKGLRIIDISDITKPVLLGSYGTYVTGIAVQDDYAYIFTSPNDFEVIKISNPKNPYKVGFISQLDCSSMFDLIVEGTKAYAVLTCGIGIISIANPAAPFIMHKHDSVGAQDLVIHNQIAYVAAGNDGLEVLNISNPYNTQNISQLSLNYSVFDICFKDDIVYLADDNNGLTIINVSDVNNLKVLDNSLDLYTSFNLAMSNDVIYLLTSISNAYSIDVTDPNDPQKISVLDLGGTTESVAVDGDFAYIANGIDGLAILDVSYKRNPILLSRANTGNYSVRVRLQNNYAYVTTQFIASCAIWEKIVIYDITDTNNPQYISEFCMGYPIRDMQFYGNYLYVLTHANLKIYDISNPILPVLMNQYTEYERLYSLKVIDDILLLGTRNGLLILELLTPYNVSPIDFCFNNTAIYGIAIEDNKGVLLAGIEDAGTRIMSVDFSDLTKPVNKSYVQIESLFSYGYFFVYEEDFIIKNNKVYVATFERFVVLQMKNNGQLVEFGQFTSEGLCGFVISDKIIYLSSRFDGLLIINGDFLIDFGTNLLYYIPIAAFLIVLFIVIRRRKNV